MALAAIASLRFGLLSPIYDCYCFSVHVRLWVYILSSLRNKYVYFTTMSIYSNRFIQKARMYKVEYLRVLG